jgi:hypothetical protein
MQDAVHNHFKEVLVPGYSESKKSSCLAERSEASAGGCCKLPLEDTPIFPITVVVVVSGKRNLIN